LRAPNCCTRYSEATQSSSDRCLKAIVSRIQSLTNGTSYGQVLHVSHTSMRDLMNIKRSITFLIVMRSRAKTGCVTTTSSCNRNSEEAILTSFLILIFFLMSMGTFMLTFKIIRKKTQNETPGLWNRQTRLEEEVSTSQTTSTRFLLMSSLLSANTLRTLYLLTAISLI